MSFKGASSLIITIILITAAVASIIYVFLLRGSNRTTIEIVEEEPFIKEIEKTLKSTVFVVSFVDCNNNTLYFVLHNTGHSQINVNEMKGIINKSEKVINTDISCTKSEIKRAEPVLCWFNNIHCYKDPSYKDYGYIEIKYNDYKYVVPLPDETVVITNKD